VRLAAGLLVALALFVGAPATSAVRPIPNFDHVFVVVFENKERSGVLGTGKAPTFNTMARRYAQLTRYAAVAHPSLPNYIALISGSTQGIRTNCTACIVRAPSIADTLERSGRTWKGYAEGLPRPGFTGAYANRFAKKHMPFLYFRDIVSEPARRNRIVPFSRLKADLANETLPDFALVVPDTCNSMHDCPVRTGDRWLARLLPPLLELPNTVVFVTFDEGVTRNQVVALALGTAVRPGTKFNGASTHYSLLRTVEDAWSLPRLGLSARANPITNIWR
jgi:phosphatidylinositol-3-phosphatase